MMPAQQTFDTTSSPCSGPASLSLSSASARAHTEAEAAWEQVTVTQKQITLKTELTRLGATLVLEAAAEIDAEERSRKFNLPLLVTPHSPAQGTREYAQGHASQLSMHCIKPLSDVQMTPLPVAQERSSCPVMHCTVENCHALKDLCNDNTDFHQQRLHTK